jgi:hypothetical protein
MTVGLVLDFPGGTKRQYEDLRDRMQLGGYLPPGGQVHTAGPHAGDWRVIDVWENLGAFERFRDEQIVPNAAGTGLAPPRMRVLDVDDEMPDDGRAPAFVQFVYLPGLDRAAFRAVHEQVVPGGVRPDGVVFHVNGPFEDGWCVIDGWTSKSIRDQFMEGIGAIIAAAPLSGAPTIEELTVEATLPARTAARA